MLPVQGRKSKLTFQSGLNNNLIRLQSTFNCKQAEEYLNKQGIKSDFLQNKPMALSINHRLILKKIRFYSLFI